MALSPLIETVRKHRMASGRFKMKAVSKPANITQTDADKAVLDYLRGSKAL